MPVGAGDHLIENFQIFAIPAVVVPIGLCHAPAGRFLIVQQFEPLLLLLLGDVEEEFHQHVPVVGNLLLKVHDLVEPVVEIAAGEAFLIPRHRNRAVPAPVKDRRVPVGGQRLPEGPHPRIPPLVRRRREDAVHRKTARVEVGDQAGDLVPLAGGAPPFKDKHHRDLQRADALLKHAELLFQAVGHRVPLLFFHPNIQIQIFQHHLFLAFHSELPPIVPGAERFLPRAHERRVVTLDYTIFFHFLQPESCRITKTVRQWRTVSCQSVVSMREKAAGSPQKETT